MELELRSYQPADCPLLAELFFDTVHAVCVKDYTEEQLTAWASGTVDLVKWNNTFLQHSTIVAAINGSIVGFGDMDSSGYLDKLYVHKKHQGQGVATAIVARLERQAQGNCCFSTYASITAKPFFEKRGYCTVRQNKVVRDNVTLINFCMQKTVLEQK